MFSIILPLDFILHTIIDKLSPWLIIIDNLSSLWSWFCHYMRISWPEANWYDNNGDNKTCLLSTIIMSQNWYDTCILIWKLWWQWDMLIVDNYNDKTGFDDLDDDNWWWEWNILIIVGNHNDFNGMVRRHSHGGRTGAAEWRKRRSGGEIKEGLPQGKPSSFLLTAI